MKLAKKKDKNLEAITAVMYYVATWLPDLLFSAPRAHYVNSFIAALASSFFSSFPCVTTLSPYSPSRPAFIFIVRTCLLGKSISLCRYICLSMLALQFYSLQFIDCYIELRLSLDLHPYIASDISSFGPIAAVSDSFPFLSGAMLAIISSLAAKMTIINDAWIWYLCKCRCGVVSHTADTAR